MSDAIEKRLQELRELAGEYAKAQAERTYLEEFRRSKIAILMKYAEREGFKSAAAQEREALANNEYLLLLDGLKAATEAAEKSRWLLKIAEMGCELYRTQQANQRVERRGYGA